MLESGANTVPQPLQTQNKISLPILSTNNPQGAASSSAIVLLNNEGQNADTEMIQHDYQAVSVTAKQGDMNLDQMMQPAGIYDTENNLGASEA